MLFNSLVFLAVFLPLTLAGYFLLARLRWTTAARGWLTVASLVFYGAWDWRYLPLLLGSIAFNYLIGERILAAGGPGGRRWQAVGILCNLALLGVYKYTDFFIGSANGLLGLGLETWGLILPLGISFFTFTQIAYLVDAQRGEVVRSDPLTYALFVTYFPHLIAGPIIHHRSMIPQFLAVRNFLLSHRNLSIGLTWFILGLAKKMLVADRLAVLSEPAFSQAHQADAATAWIGVVAYTLQLYFDFSGYSDMAIGLGRCLNHDLPLNFASPYQATSISDFWRRWHISLSTFLRDYLYIPLGGNRLGHLRQMGNLLVTMLLGGLWHGAGWTFVMWGGLHGAYLAINHQWRRSGLVLPTAIAWPLTIMAVMVGWVFFRAASFSDASAILAAMCGLGPTTGTGGWPGREILMLAGGCLLAFCCPNTQQIMARFRPTWWWAGISLALLLACAARFGTESPFLYYQF
ncbi:MAG TPA: membrane-bound O-acyltransferase family protein [Planctomycetes bacterium]|nr:membrane-bound O-acyltransferase family protein [Planctomycetota bacterium]